jgi:EAL domain-containing protein (putative c-di-GMP-specific phosphodiesterase class I)
MDSTQRAPCLPCPDAEPAVRPAPAPGRTGPAPAAGDEARNSLIFLVMYYQPQLRLAEGRISGFEALLRWINPDGSVLLPGDFIRFIEANDMIVGPSRWVLGEVCRQQARWRAAGMAPLTLSVNFSPSHLQREGVDAEIAQILEATGADPALLEIELTEGVRIERLAALRTAMDRLRRRGVRFALDDYGAGSAQHLDMLRALPFSTVKIDRSLIAAIGDPQNDIILRNTIGLIHELGMEALAEGVETGTQLAFLRRTGCDLVQGYWIGKPMPPAEVDGFLVRFVSRALP